MSRVHRRFGKAFGLLLGLTVASTAQTRPPAITRIANAATYEIPAEGLARQSLFTMFGQDLAAEARSTSPPLPVELGGVRVSVGGQPAPLLYVSPTQINAQVPNWDFPAEVVVSTRTGTAKATLPNPFTGAAPGIFLRGSGSCGSPFIFNVLPDGSWQANSPATGAPPGSWIVILATGTGIAGKIKYGEAAPADLGLRGNFPSVIGVRFNRTYAPTNYPHDFTYNGKLAGTVGVDQVNARVPPDLPEGCAVPLQLDTGRYKFGPQSQTVPVTISGTQGTCTDPPPESSAVIRLERVETSGFEPSGNKNVITLEFIRARGRSLLEEGHPDYVLRRTVNNLRGCSTSAYDFFEKLTGPFCPGFEAYRGEPLDPGTIIVAREDGGPEVVLVPRQNQDGQWGYWASLPEDMLREGTVRIRGLGGPDVGPFETSVEFPPFRFLTDLSPGAQLPARVFLFEWTGGNPDDTIRISWGDLDSRVKGQQCLERVGDGRYVFGIPNVPGYPPMIRPGDPISEINFVIEPAEPGTTTFQAAGLTLGGRVERRMVYRFRGLVAK